MLSSAVSALEKGWQWDQALSCLKRMMACGPVPNTVAINAAVSACGKGSEAQRAWALMKSSRMDQIKVDEIGFNAAASAFAEAGSSWQDAAAVLAAAALQG